jgi:hypothetical protein
MAFEHKMVGNFDQLALMPAKMFITILAPSTKNTSARQLLRSLKLTPTWKALADGYQFDLNQGNSSHVAVFFRNTDSYGRQA